MTERQEDAKKTGNMNHLIKSLRGPELEHLRRAYSVLAGVYLRRRSGGDVAENQTADSGYEQLRDRVLTSEEIIDLTDARQECELITAISERPVELFNNLGQVEVLIAAIDIMREAGLSAERCAPTQQSTDDTGESIPDLLGTASDGSDWALEAFGGHNYRNSSKIAEDLCSLKRWYTKDMRIFLAFRDVAWTN